MTARFAGWKKKVGFRPPTHAFGQSVGILSKHRTAREHLREYVPQ